MTKKLKVRCAVPCSDAAERMEYKEFEVDVEGEVTVLDVLKILYREKDETIAFHSFCRQGLCASCVVELNGRRVLSCATPALDGMEIKPILE